MLCGIRLSTFKRSCSINVTHTFSHSVAREIELRGRSFGFGTVKGGNTTACRLVQDFLNIDVKPFSVVMEDVIFDVMQSGFYIREAYKAINPYFVVHEIYKVKHAVNGHCILFTRFRVNGQFFDMRKGKV